MKKIAILGSTGSIGKQTLDVVKNYSDKFEVVAISGYQNIDELVSQAKEFNPKHITVMDKESLELLKSAGVESKLHHGIDGLEAIATLSEVDLVVISTVGSIGLRPTMAAIYAGKEIALANKEVLVMAGELVMKTAKKHEVQILPIDSEHSAIFQCLMGGRKNDVKRIIITASGGPFRTYSDEELETVTVEDALAHPTWNMGSKITIDSATLMNKGLEVIECCHLFDVPVDIVDVLVHPQSYVHSLVEFADGSYIAQVGPTDMRIPIQYALTYPERWPVNINSINLAEIGQLIFEAPKWDRFPCLKLAFNAIKTGGTMPVVLSVTNETAVQAFLDKKISFVDISKMISQMCESHDVIQNPSLQNILSVEKETREKAGRLIQ